MARVDVAVPCYQHGAFLRDCVASVLGQGVDVRVLIVDNASSDDSPAVARELAADPRVEVVLRERNLGPHASFNAGVDWARGDYFMVLCSDDLLAPGSLAEMVAALERHPGASFALGRDVHWAAGAPAPELVKPAFPAAWMVVAGREFIRGRCRRPEGYIAAGMVLVRTAAQKAAGHYRPELPHTDDFELLLRLALLGDVAETAAVVGIKRMHAENRTHDYLAERTRDLVERIAALESFFAREGRALADADALLALGRRSIAERAYWCGLKDLVRGRRSALDLLRLAVRYSPRAAVLPPFGYLARMERSLLESVRG
jgi:glycosyltransferase involved in cell wall biosynthesis